MSSQSSRSRLRWIIGPLFILAMAAVMTADAGDWVRCRGSIPSCERKWASNVDYFCVNPGSHCDTFSGCSCKDVKGASSIVAWHDCICLRWSKTARPGAGCGTGGRESCALSEPIRPNTMVNVRLEPDRGSALEVYCLADVGENGQIGNSQELSGPDHVEGFFDLMIEDGPPEAIPSRIMGLDVIVHSVMFMGVPTGTNHLVLGPGGPDVVGSYNMNLGVVQFDEGVPIMVHNDLWPDGRLMHIRPGMTVMGDTRLDVMPSGIIWIPMRLAGPFPGMVGQMNVLELEGALENTPVFAVYGFKRGETGVPGCPGVVLDIQRAKLLGKSMSDSFGHARFQFFVPKAASGRTILFQAVEIFDCETSDLIEYTFP